MQGIYEGSYPKETTTERLQLAVSGSYGAVVKYGSFVLVTDAHWKAGYTAAVYQFIISGAQTIEDPVILVEEAPKRFEDNGHALEWCMNWVKGADAK